MVFWKAKIFLGSHFKGNSEKKHFSQKTCRSYCRRINELFKSITILAGNCDTVLIGKEKWISLVRFLCNRKCKDMRRMGEEETEEDYSRLFKDRKEHI